jgi:hypothetical protein
MRHARRTILAIGAAALLAWPLLTPPGFAQSPSTTRIHGTITALKGGALAVQTTGGEAVTIAFDPKTPIISVAAASLADIKPGSFVGSAARAGADGKLVALEVHIFPEKLRGTGEGTTMTNGTVGSDIANVSSVSGRTITVRYAGGEQKITVPAGVPVVYFDVGDATLLTRGAHVSVTATEAADGTLGATRITVGKAGVTPPL